MYNLPPIRKLKINIDACLVVKHVKFDMGLIAFNHIWEAVLTNAFFMRGYHHCYNVNYKHWFGLLGWLCKKISAW